MMHLEGFGMTVREELHKLIDTLADDQIAEVREYVDELRGEESLSEETLAAVRQGLNDIEHGRVMDVDEYRRTRGL
jgi:predicted transcriptional regulator